MGRQEPRELQQINAVSSAWIHSKHQIIHFKCLIKVPKDSFGAVEDAPKCPFSLQLYLQKGRDLKKVRVRSVIPLQRIWVP